MAIRIRVYPQGMGAFGMGGYGMGALGMGGYNRMGAVSASTFFNSRLSAQRQVTNLQLGYERALHREQLQRVRLEERLQNPYALASANPFAMQQMYNPYATAMLGSQMLGAGTGFFGSLGLGRFF